MWDETFDGMVARFEKGQPTWKVQQGSLRNDRDHGHAGERDWDHDHAGRLYFGVDQKYASLIPLVWSLVDNETVKIHPPKKGAPIEDVIAWWLAPVHLLTYGLGWNTFKQGLEAWRVRDLDEDNHILRFIKRNWGESIVALLYFYAEEAEGRDRIRRLYFGTPSSNTEDQLVTPATEHLFRPLGMNINGISGPSLYALNEIFDGGMCDFNMRPWTEGEWAKLENGRMNFNFQRYEGWMKRASEHVQHLDEQNETYPRTSQMSVYVEGIGSMGNYEVSSDTGCWVRKGRDTAGLFGDWYRAGYTDQLPPKY